MNRLPLFAVVPLLAACSKETPRDAPVVAATASSPPATPTPSAADAAAAPEVRTTTTAPATPTTTSPRAAADAGAPGSAEACNAKCTADGRCTTLAACSDCLSMCMVQGGPPLQGALSRTPSTPTSAKKK